MPPEPESPAAAPTGVPASLSAAMNLVEKGQQPAPVPSPAPAPEEAKPAPTPEPKVSKPDAKPGNPLDELTRNEPSESPLPTDKEAKKTDAADPEPIPEGKAGYRIQALKEEIKTIYKPEIDRLQNELAQQQSKAEELKGVAQELESLREYKTRMEAELGVVELTKTDAYQKEVGVPLDTIATGLKSLAEANEIDPGKLLDAALAPTAAERNKLIKDALSGLDIDEADRYAIRRLIDDAQPLLDKKDEFYQNADKALLELKAKKETESAAAAAARAEDHRKATDMVAERVVKSLPFLKGTIEEVAEGVKQLDLDALDSTNKAYYALAGAALPKVIAERNAVSEERDRLLDEIDTLKKALPVTPGGLTTPAITGQMPRSLAEAANMAAAR